MKEKMPNLTVYDQNKYDYSTYWSGREYEHRAELMALSVLRQGKRKKGWFIDVGGSYGRLYKTYANKYLNTLIVDYSLLALKQARKTLGDEVNLVAANVYNLPFRDSTFQGGQMIRVLHHLEDQYKGLKELERVMSADSEFVLEFPNKLHIKNRVKALRDKEFAKRLFTEGPFNPDSDGNPQGIKAGQKGVFYDYDMDFIRELLRRTQFIIAKVRGVSILRARVFKRYLPLWLMLFIERCFQCVSHILLWTPSVFLKLFKGTGDNYYEGSELKEILICPKCKGEVSFNADKATCMDCKESFKFTQGVWDFRWPKVK